jgi:hypothetical protein
MAHLGRPKDPVQSGLEIRGAVLEHEGSLEPSNGAPPVGTSRAFRKIPVWAAFAAVTTVLLAAYCANGDFLPVNDAIASTYLPVHFLSRGRLSFTPSEMPFMFVWELQTDNGVETGSFSRWDESYGGVPLRELYRSGALKVLTNAYYVVPSVRSASATHERLYLNAYGPGAALTALPVFVVMRLFVDDLALRPSLLWYGGKAAAALLTALTGGIIFLTTRRFLDALPAIALALAYGLGTCVWSTSSQALWQHAPNAFFLSLGAWSLLRVPDDARQAVWAGLAFSAAVACRPTSIAVIAAVAAWLLVESRRALVSYVSGALPIAAAMLAYNGYYFGSPVDFGQTTEGARIAMLKTGSPDVWQTPVWFGAVAHLLSPSRGLLVFSPWLVLGLIGAVVAWTGRKHARLRPLTVALGALLVVTFKWTDWWGGWSFGYRLLVDAVLFLVVLAIPLTVWVFERRIALIVMLSLLGWSVFVQVLGAFAYDLDGWNARFAGYAVTVAGQPRPLAVVGDLHEAQRLAREGDGRSIAEARLDVDRREHRGRLWSLADNQIAYYIAHFSESRRHKHALMSSACGE